MTRVMILLDDALAPDVIEEWQRVAADFSAYHGAPVLVATGPAEGLGEVDRLLEQSRCEWRVRATDEAPAAAPKNAAMSSAPFVYREDGRPDWAAMWTNFCELALYGGPPHRGEAEALHAPEISETDAAAPMMAEIRRGIYETTGLFAEPAEPGWIAVTCRSARMAAWLCATILLENVDARCAGERLYLPASPGFALKNEVKSVVTVLAKTNHYWEAHVAATEQAARAEAADNR